MLRLKGAAEFRFCGAAGLLDGGGKVADVHRCLNDQGERPHIDRIAAQVAARILDTAVRAKCWSSSFPPSSLLLAIVARRIGTAMMLPNLYWLAVNRPNRKNKFATQFHQRDK